MPKKIKKTDFDIMLLTTEEIEEWARLRSYRDKLSGEVLWKHISAEVDFIQHLQAKYNMQFSISHGSVDEYIKSRRRAFKVGVILDNHPNE
jgi:hypothetical protein